MSLPRLYAKYPCTRNAPLSCDRPWQTIQDFKGAKFCMDCGFPAALMAGQEIRGRKGVYQVKQFLGARGYGRLYSGVRSGDSQPVVIKEYLLPEQYFNSAEAKRRQEAFEQLAGLIPADGRVQDFRLAQPLEAIATPKEPQCYLITAEKMPPPTLRQFLASQAAMSPEQVREVLNQALQTLQFLHTQKFRRPSGQIEKGTVHGNLNLDSLLISGKPNQFYIYLCDLASWEFLFDPALSLQRVEAEPGEDLVNLGRIGFELWRGQEAEPEFDVNLYNDQPWMRTDPALREFLLRLMGFGTPFESAEAARQALPHLSQDGQTSEAAATDGEALNRRKTRLWWILTGILLLLLGSLVFFFMRKTPGNGESYADFKGLTEKFTDITGMQPGEYPYASEADSTWSTVLPMPKVNGAKLENLLMQPNPNQRVFFKYQQVRTERLLQDSSVPSAAIQSVRQQKFHFAITTLPDPNTSSSDPYSADPIAYDGLLVYVPFSLQGESLPGSLQGGISLENLRKIFTGHLKNWSEIGGLNRPIDFSIPTDPEAIYWFKKRVLKDDPQMIAEFNQFINQKNGITSETLQNNLNTFDNNGPGIISFGILSSVWDQCKGYPLAILDDQGSSFQPLRRNASDQPITPSDPICDKANHLDVHLFTSGRYPLGYPLTVVYPKGDLRLSGSWFALLLKTQQGQCALSKVGLVPLQPVPQNCTPPQPLP